MTAHPHYDTGLLAAAAARDVTAAVSVATVIALVLLELPPPLLPTMTAVQSPLRRVGLARLAALVLLDGRRDRGLAGARRGSVRGASAIADPRGPEGASVLRVPRDVV